MVWFSLGLLFGILLHFICLKLYDDYLVLHSIDHSSVYIKGKFYKIITEKEYCDKLIK